MTAADLRAELERLTLARMSSWRPQPCVIARAADQRIVAYENGTYVCDVGGPEWRRAVHAVADELMQEE